MKPVQISILIKPFSDLSTTELYGILKARGEVFVVEQQIVYNDMDDVDFRSIHVALWNDNKVIAYARAYEEHGDWHIGRVLTTVRGKGYGREIMKAAIDHLRGTGAHRLVLDSQEYAVGFYEKIGFSVCSDLFYIDTIPHYKMEMSIKSNN